MCRPLLIAFMLFLTSGAFANTSLRSAVREYVATIAPKLQSLDIGVVRVGEFPASGTALLASAGPKISKVVIEELELQGISVKLVGAGHVISGSYKQGTDSKGLLVVQIEFNVVDKSGKNILSDSRGSIPEHLIVTDKEDLAVLTGSSVEFVRSKTNEDIRTEMREKIEKPDQTRQVHDSELRVSHDSPLGFEVLVQEHRGGEFVPRPIKCEDGVAFVEIKKGEQYHIRLINESDNAVAARVTIDGLSVFEFSKVRKQKKSPDELDEPEYSHFILPANPGKQPLTPIPGWHITNQEAETFLVTDYQNSALYRAKIPPSNSQIGTICVEFASTTPAGSRGRNGTGFGEPVATDYKPVHVGIGDPIAVLSLRYTK